MVDLNQNIVLYKSYIGVYCPKSIFMQLWDFEEGLKMGKIVVKCHEQNILDRLTIL